MYSDLYMPWRFGVLKCCLGRFRKGHAVSLALVPSIEDMLVGRFEICRHVHKTSHTKPRCHCFVIRSYVWNFILGHKIMFFRLYWYINYRLSPLEANSLLVSTRVGFQNTAYCYLATFLFCPRYTCIWKIFRLR